MKRYSKRERVAAALLTPVFASVGFGVTYILFTDASMREVGTFAGAAGGWAGAIIAARIAVTGGSTRFLEQPADRVFGQVKQDDE